MPARAFRGRCRRQLVYKLWGMPTRGFVVRALMLSTHPVPTAGVTVISAGLAALAGLDLRTGALFTAAVLAGQLSIGWSNDRIDAGRDKVAGRTDKPVAGGAIGRRAVAFASATALVLTIVLSLLLGPRSALAALTLVAAGWLYNLGLKSTVLSWVPYAVGFGALPAAATLARAGHPWPAWWAMAAGALLGVAAHAANVLPDLQTDRTTGVQGLWHRLGGRVTAVGGPVLLGVASALVLFGAGGVEPWKWAALGALLLLGAVGVAVGLAKPSSRVLFIATMVLAGLDILLFAVSGRYLS